MVETGTGSKKAIVSEAGSIRICEDYSYVC